MSVPLPITLATFANGEAAPVTKHNSNSGIIESALNDLSNEFGNVSHGGSNLAMGMEAMFGPATRTTGYSMGEEDTLIRKVWSVSDVGFIRSFNLAMKNTRIITGSAPLYNELRVTRVMVGAGGTDYNTHYVVNGGKLWVGEWRQVINVPSKTFRSEDYGLPYATQIGHHIQIHALNGHTYCSWDYPTGNDLIDTTKFAGASMFFLRVPNDNVKYDIHVPSTSTGYYGMQSKTHAESPSFTYGSMGERLDATQGAATFSSASATNINEFSTVTTTIALTNGVSTASVPVADSDRVTYKLTGNYDQNVTITLGSILDTPKWFSVENAATGSGVITIKGPLGTGAVVPVNGTAMYTHDGTDVFLSANSPRGNEIAITAGTTLTINWAAADCFRITLTDNLTLTMTGARSGQRCAIKFIQDGTGSRTITFGAEVAFGTDVTGMVLTTTPNALDEAGFIYDWVATKYHGVALTKGF